MATSALVSGGKLQAVVTSAIVSGGTLSSSPQTTAIVSGGTLSSTAAATKACVSAGFLRPATLEPFTPVTLPAGTWTQISGPTVAPPNVVVPGVYVPPGSSPAVLKYTQPNGTEFDITALPHTIFYRDSSGTLRPIRRVPA